jgi:hypothetical protein
MKLLAQSRKCNRKCRFAEARKRDLFSARTVICYRNAIIASSRWRSSPVRNATLRRKLSLTHSTRVAVDYTEATMIIVREPREPDQNRYEHRATGFPLGRISLSRAADIEMLPAALHALIADIAFVAP